VLDLDPEVFAGLQPARPLPTDDDAEPLEELGLCLSGGGYRAMLAWEKGVQRASRRSPAT
jgi:hypothetical protein